jgi:hypothetical protein
MCCTNKFFSDYNDYITIPEFVSKNSSELRQFRIYRTLSQLKEVERLLNMNFFCYAFSLPRDCVRAKPDAFMYINLLHNHYLIVFLQFNFIYFIFSSVFRCSQAHVVSAFEKSLSSMTQRIQQLTATNEKKVRSWFLHHTRDPVCTVYVCVRICVELAKSAVFFFVFVLVLLFFIRTGFGYKYWHSSFVFPLNTLFLLAILYSIVLW